jgi:hypothetical protein
MINKEQFYDRLNFAWLGSNPSYAPEDQHTVGKKWLAASCR